MVTLARRNSRHLESTWEPFSRLCNRSLRRFQSKLKVLIILWSGDMHGICRLLEVLPMQPLELDQFNWGCRCAADGLSWLQDVGSLQKPLLIYVHKTSDYLLFTVLLAICTVHRLYSVGGKSTSSFTFTGHTACAPHYFIWVVPQFQRPGEWQASWVGPILLLCLFLPLLQ